MKRVAITLAVLGLLAAGAAYACNPVSVGYSNVGYSRTVSYVQPTVSIVSPYTPQVTLAAQYAAPVAAPQCVCEQPQVAAPAAYEAPVAAPAVRYAAPTVSYAAVAAPAVSYAAVGVPVVSYAHVGVGHHVAVGVSNVYSNVRVGVSAVRARPSVTVVRAKSGRVGLRERFQVKRAAVRAARAAR